MEDAQVRQDAAAVRQTRKAEKDAVEAQEARRTVGQFLLNTAGGETVNQIVKLTGLPRKQVQEAVAYLHRRGAIEPGKVCKSGGRAGRRGYDGWLPKPSLAFLLSGDVATDNPHGAALCSANAPASAAPPPIPDAPLSSTEPPPPVTSSPPEESRPTA